METLAFFLISALASLTRIDRFATKSPFPWALRERGFSVLRKEAPDGAKVIPVCRRDRRRAAGPLGHGSEAVPGWLRIPAAKLATHYSASWPC